MSRVGLVLRHLVFTGPQKTQVELSFEEGLNLLYGASNTGKSFTLKTIDFMLGGSDPLPDIRQRVGYDTILLGLTQLGVGDFTLVRSMAGGPFHLYEGLVKVHDPSMSSQILAATQKSLLKPNLPQFLLAHLGLVGKKVAKNANGEKENLSFRDLVAISLVDETSIQSERSPVESNLGPVTRTKERSVFRLLLTGIDDSSITAVVDDKTFSTSKSARIEVIEELLQGVRQRLVAEFADRTSLESQSKRIESSLDSRQAEIISVQESVRLLISEKRFLVSAIPEMTQRVDAIVVHLQRFSQLDSIYQSDVLRLSGLEEAGYLLTTEHLHACVLCGAPPEAQTQNGTIDLNETREAALAEIQKIEKHRKDLAITVADLNDELKKIEADLPNLENRLVKVEGDIAAASSPLSFAQTSLRELLAARSYVQEGLHLLEQSEQYEQRLREYSELKKPGKEDKPKLTAPTLSVHEFSQTVSAVLKAWDFPGELSVSFDEKSYDLIIDGNLRINNGKGVRAVTHAAFKVALLIYCRARNLPHPGFVVLDTPLLTYRDPMKNPSGGELSADEKLLAQSSLKEKFFQHLSSLSNLGQFLVLENVDPPEGIHKIAHVEVFYGASSEGRAGLFPLTSRST